MSLVVDADEESVAEASSRLATPDDLGRRAVARLVAAARVRAPDLALADTCV